MPGRKKILIAEDHTILREALRMLLSSNPNLVVVGEAKDGLEAIGAADAVKPDLILMDLSMPRLDGISAIAEIKKQDPSTKILVLTVHNAEEHILKALKAGADGYILKDANSRELMLAIETLLSGKSYLRPNISKKIKEGCLQGKNGVTAPTSLDALTNRERETLRMIVKGYTNKEMADFLHISIKTVESHRTNLMRKLGVHDASSLIAFAIKNGLITK